MSSSVSLHYVMLLTVIIQLGVNDKDEEVALFATFWQQKTISSNK